MPGLTLSGVLRCLGSIFQSLPRQTFNLNFLLITVFAAPTKILFTLQYSLELMLQSSISTTEFRTRWVPISSITAIKPTGIIDMCLCIKHIMILTLYLWIRIWQQIAALFLFCIKVVPKPSDFCFFSKWFWGNYSFTGSLNGVILLIETTQKDLCEMSQSWPPDNLKRSLLAKKIHRNQPLKGLFSLCSCC